MQELKGRNLKAGATEECVLLVLSLAHSDSFIIHPGTTCLRNGVTHSGLFPPTINNQNNHSQVYDLGNSLLEASLR